MGGSVFNTAAQDTVAQNAGENGSESIVDSVEQSFSEMMLSFWEFLGTVLFEIQDASVTVGNLLVFFLLFFLTFVVAKMISRQVHQRVLSRIKMDDGIRYTLSRILYYLIIILGVMFSIQFIGLDLSGLVVIFGLLSVGIGFGLQNLTANFISGLILLFERPISIGDRIIVNDIEGDVKEINMRSTTINSINNISIIVPNSDFISGRVVNYSHGDTTIRVDIPVGVSYSSDLDLVLRVIKSAGVENEEVLKTPEPMVMFMNFGDSSWDLELRVWILNPKRHPFVKSDIYMDIVRKFEKHNIEIPFPQRDLHLRSSVPFPLEDKNGTKSEE